MTHRKHVHEWEIDPVADTIREQLIQMVPLHDPRELLTTDEQSLFHVLYRFENHAVGKPSYPQPESWGTVAQYLGVMVPLLDVGFLHQTEENNNAPRLNQQSG